MMRYMKNETRHFYDTVYGRYKPGESHCLHSIDNLDKARKRVTLVFKAFGLHPLPMGARTPPVFYSKKDKK